MKRNIRRLLVGAALLLVLLSACGGGQRPGSEGSPALQTAGMPSTVPASENPDSDTPRPLETSTGPSETEQAVETEASTAAEQGEEHIGMNMNVQIDSSVFTATLESNPAAEALAAMMEEGPVTIRMSDYAVFEKVGSLGTSLPTSNSQTTTQAGDIVLYQGNQIVIFYGSNSWSYTRLGRIDDLTGWEEALGSGDVTVTFSLGD